MFGGEASADTQLITALFKPNPAQPRENKFLNTTQQSSICLAHIPAQCKALGIFSLRFESFGARSMAPVLANHADPRAGAYFKVPSSFKDVEVRNTRTGELEIVQVRIAGVGSLWRLPRPPGVSAWTQPGLDWGEAWRQAPSPCSSTRHLAASTTYASFFWVVPQDAGACSRVPSVDIPSFDYFSLEYAYELVTPNPLTMLSGQYVGSTSYTFGGMGADFDFGDNMVVSSDAVVTLDFILDVQHELRVEIPPGGNAIELVPQGGWQAWLNQGRKPTRLFRDQTFNISSSSPFAMQMSCEYSNGAGCDLAETTTGRRVPLHVAVSLPAGLTDDSGQAVKRRPLRLDGSGTTLFQPSYYVNRGPGTLHFEVVREDVEKMLVPDVEATYRGNVTVVWDSEV
ncbi:hypothetical protein [Pseudomonas kitaguniensis]|uniref:hypothetical protein n=1 Tax=Pseudomonas kitaguniensis TaxID=2607908 RepID=UPI003CFF047F